MSFYGFLLLCIQACLIQNAFASYRMGSPVIPALYPYNYGSNARAINEIDVGIDILSLGAAEVNGLGGLYGIGPAGYGYGGASASSSASAAAAGASAGRAASGSAAFGAVGEGEISVGGTIGASGTTYVDGSIPVIGSVAFDGSLPASGFVYLTGNCGCAHLV